MREGVCFFREAVMSLSNETVSVLIDLVQNKIDRMEIHDRDDLHQRVLLEKALAELSGRDPAQSSFLQTWGDVPTRGRRRKIPSFLGGKEK